MKKKAGELYFINLWRHLSEQFGLKDVSLTLCYNHKRFQADAIKAEQEHTGNFQIPITYVNKKQNCTICELRRVMKTYRETYAV